MNIHRKMMKMITITMIDDNNDDGDDDLVVVRSSGYTSIVTCQIEKQEQHRVRGWKAEQ